MSKEAIRKIAYKHIMWKIYRNTGTIEDYNNYKKALNLATAEMRKSKRSCEQKFANDIRKYIIIIIILFKHLISLHSKFRGVYK